MANTTLASTQPPPDFESDINALLLQLQEIYSDRDQKEKYPKYKPPDNALAFLNFEAELKRCLLLLSDQRLAQ
jgi:hypothetical protein